MTWFTLHIYLMFQTKCEDDEDFAILKFHAGPPYEVRLKLRRILLIKSKL